jgi:hypothetical protein
MNNDMTIKLVLDTQVNRKLFKKIQRKYPGQIQEISLYCENNRQKDPRKMAKTIAVWRFTHWGESLYPSDGSKEVYNEVKSIISPHNNDNVKDVIMFEAFLRSEANIFITEDKDFLSVRQELIDTFKTQIMTLVEFGKHLESN